MVFAEVEKLQQQIEQRGRKVRPIKGEQARKRDLRIEVSTTFPYCHGKLL